jgi:hypothetical protein
MAGNERYASNLLTDNLYKEINVLDGESCWLWNGSLNHDGYGVAKRMIDGKSYGSLIHRISWYLNFGQIPEGMVIDHKCHNPKDCVNGIRCEHRRCFNPYHLRLSTVLENTNRGANRRHNVGLCRNNLHEWVSENIRIQKGNKKMCIPCINAQVKRKADKRKAVLNGK